MITCLDDLLSFVLSINQCYFPECVFLLKATGVCYKLLKVEVHRKDSFTGCSSTSINLRNISSAKDRIITFMNVLVVHVHEK